MSNLIKIAALEGVEWINPAIADLLPRNSSHANVDCKCIWDGISRLSRNKSTDSIILPSIKQDYFWMITYCVTCDDILTAASFSSVQE